MYNNFESNELIEAVLYNKHRIRSYISYRILLYKIKRSTPNYNMLNTIYNFIDQLNFAYFHCLTDDDLLFILDNRNKNNKNRSLVYKDGNTEIVFYLKPDNIITLKVRRKMGYKETSYTFKDSESNFLNNKLEEQLFINCTNLLMNELYRMVKKYRKFAR